MGDFKGELTPKLIAERRRLVAGSRCAEMMVLYRLKIKPVLDAWFDTLADRLMRPINRMPNAETGAIDPRGLPLAGHDELYQAVIYADGLKHHWYTYSAFFAVEKRNLYEASTLYILVSSYRWNEPWFSRKGQIYGYRVDLTKASDEELLQLLDQTWEYFAERVQQTDDGTGFWRGFSPFISG